MKCQLISIAVMVLWNISIGAPASGTPPRREIELKLSFLVPPTVSTNRITSIIYHSIVDTLARGESSFEKRVQQRFQVDKKFQPFIFRDIYLDTEDSRVFRSGSGYRLRYRWNAVWEYFVFKWLPFLPWVYPNRCEIQFKTAYQWKGNWVDVEETRFEFRDFQPRPPWPEKEYLTYAATGQFQGHSIVSMERLKERLGVPLDSSLVLQPRAEFVTRRDRLHLNQPENPWGSGPNPQNVILVTWDSAYYRKWNEKKWHSLVELEIEIERNTLDEIDRILKADSNPRIDFLKGSAFGALQDLKKDVTDLSEVLKGDLTRKLRGELILPASKLSRVFMNISEGA